MTEADYICFLAKDITLEYFQNGGFYVLPEFNNDRKAVYFPNLNYTSKFWSLISKCKARDLGDVFPKEAVAEVASKIKLNKSKRITHDGITFDLLETEYGTVGSYDKYVMTHRKDNSRQEFEKTFTLMKLLLKNKDRGEIGDVIWHKRNAIIEYLFGKFKSKESLELAKQSEKYLEKLGFGSKIEIPEIKSLTRQEEDVLNLLKRNQGEIVTFDEVANCLWKERSDDKFSLEAMAKVVENLRKKIKAKRINKELIFTKRGSGYLLLKKA